MKKVILVFLSVFMLGIGVIVTRANLNFKNNNSPNKHYVTQRHNQKTHVIQNSTERNGHKQQKNVTREDAVKIIEDFCDNPNGVTVTASSEDDIVFDNKNFYAINAVFGISPAMMFYVDSTNGDIYNGMNELDEDSMPLNH